MKKIVHRKNGTGLNANEARVLCSQLNRLGVYNCVEHRSVYGYTTPEIAEKANLRAVLEEYEGEGYTFAFAGTEYVTFEGYKVLVICIKELPSDFEKSYPNYVVIG